MNEIEKMARFLKLATNKSIVEAHQGKVENKHRLILLIVILIPILLVLKFAIFFFAMCAVVCFLIYRRAKPYIDLHSIISDLRDEDKLKFKKGSHCSNELHLHISIDTVDKESK